MDQATDRTFRTGRLQVEYRAASLLLPFANNARTHSEAQVSQIAASIREFGWTNPILVDAQNGIIAGHGRLLAAEKLGMREVPVTELAGLSEAQRRALVIADNKLALNAGWDDDLLALELGELADLGFDLALTGFSDLECWH
jgi:ParB-like chromosome segregation protein Spo0J